MMFAIIKMTNSTYLRLSQEPTSSPVIYRTTGKHIKGQNDIPTSEKQHHAEELQMRTSWPTSTPSQKKKNGSFEFTGTYYALSYHKSVSLSHSEADMRGFCPVPLYRLSFPRKHPIFCVRNMN